MYPSKYKASVRIHSVEDAITTPIHNKTPADMFLYCLDLYDVCINHMESNTTMQNVSTIKTSLTQFMSNKFIQLNERIPGQMKGWTQGMFVYTCYSGFNTLTTLDTSLNKQWMYDNRLCMTQTMDTTQWSFFIWCKSLDALELQWRTIPKDNTLYEYLEKLEYRASQFISYLQTPDVLDIPKYRIKCSETEYRIHPAGIYECYCRMMVLKRSLSHIDFFSKNVQPAPPLDDTYLKSFFLDERRHLTIRKFRDGLSAQVLIDILRDTDRFRVSYERRGSFVSPYAALANFRPLAMLDLLSKSIAYDKPDVILQNEKVPNALYLCTVHAYFSSTYNVSFREMFLCTEENAWKYRNQIITTTVPIILEMCKQYHVFAQGELYQTDGTFYHAFYTWVKLVKTMYNCILYAQMDLSHLCKKILEAPEVIEGRKTKLVEYHWD